MDLNEAFRSTFKTMFGECSLELEDLRDYLRKDHYPLVKKKSSLSGKEVAFSSDRYCEGAGFISQDEVDYGKKYALDINGIKDLDSVMDAVRDRLYYTGSKLFGKTAFAEGSDGCFDSFYVRESLNVEASKFVAYSSYVRGGSEFAFGSSYLVEANHAIRLHAGAHCARCFEAYHIHNSSDLFFAYNCHGCSHVMFSFNLRSKRYAIGNLELPKDKYFVLREKLVNESREHIEKHKRFYSMFDYVSPMKNTPCIVLAEKSRSQDKGKIEDAFKSTCKIIFGTDLGTMDEYGEYLNQGNPSIESAKTVFGSTIYPAKTFFYHLVPAARRISNREAGEAGKLHLELSEDENLASIIRKLDSIALYVCEWDEGENYNNIETPIALSATNTYRSNASSSKNVGYTVMAQSSESIFGSFRVLHSKFCINCYHSNRLARCFEMNDSSDCSDSYFCHNCENLDNCMFCFNAKSLRYAIGNVVVGRENYMKIKKIVLEEIVRKLEKDKKLDLSIYNAGCLRKGSSAGKGANA